MRDGNLLYVALEAFEWLVVAHQKQGCSFQLSTWCTYVSRGVSS